VVDKKLTINWPAIFKGLLYVGAVMALFYVDSSYAAADQAGPVAPKTLGGIATNITTSFEAIGHLLIAIAYIAGIGFGIASIFKFKQHKDNPTQIPIGTPIALLAIAIALLFLPAFFGPAGETLFGSASKTAAGGFEGTKAYLPGEPAGGGGGS